MCISCKKKERTLIISYMGSILLDSFAYCHCKISQYPPEQARLF